MAATITIMWILLANGNVVTRDYPTLEDCLSTQRILQNYAQVASDRRFDHILCIEESAIAHPTARAQ